MVFNKIEILDANYFSNTTVSSTNATLKKSVAKFFYIFRFLAVALALLTLIYVGIRMAISTGIEQKVRYKNMLIGWIESMIILFTIPYILSIVFNLSDIFTEGLFKLKDTIDPNDEYSFEQIVLDTINPLVQGGKGGSYLAYSVVYWVLTFITLKFFVTYIKRLIGIGFLITISPLITVIYSIDKAGDGRAQSFEMWLKEVLINVFIQPLHAIIYLIFMITAGEIAKYSILFSLILLLAMTKVESYIFKIFGLSAVSLKHVKDQAILGKNI